MQNFVLTAAGQSLMAALVAGTTTATFTKMQTSDHSYAASEITSLTALADVKQEEPISSIEPGDVSGTVKMLARIENSLLADGYYIRAVGLIAKNNTTGEEILYAVSIAGSDEIPDYMPVFAGLTPTGITFTFIVEVSNVDQVVMVVDPAATATVEQIENIQNQIDQMASEERLEKCEQNVLALMVAMELETNAETNGTADNIAVETFLDSSGVIIVSGSFDSVNHRLYA